MFAEIMFCFVGKRTRLRTKRFCCCRRHFPRNVFLKGVKAICVVDNMICFYENEIRRKRGLPEDEVHLDISIFILTALEVWFMYVNKNNTISTQMPTVNHFIHRWEMKRWPTSMEIQSNIKYGICRHKPWNVKT